MMYCWFWPLQFFLRQCRTLLPKTVVAFSWRVDGLFNFSYQIVSMAKESTLLLLWCLLLRWCCCFIVLSEVSAWMWEIIWEKGNGWLFGNTAKMQVQWLIVSVLYKFERIENCDFLACLIFLAICLVHQSMKKGKINSIETTSTLIDYWLKVMSK